MLSSTEVFQEYAKCLMKPIYAIETYLETFDMTQKGYVPFKLFPRQKDIIRAYEKHNRNIVTKPRQAGVSTTTAAYLSIKAGFADAKNPEAILIVANKQELAFEFLAKVKNFLSQLPRWVWGHEYCGNEKNNAKSIFLTDSKGVICLPNGSRVKAVATSKDALRGYTPTYLVMDEAAYIDNGVEVFGAALTALGTGGACILISTPNGLDELYYKTYDLAKQKKNNFNIVEMRWYEDLRYNIGLKWVKGDLEEDELEFTFNSYEDRVANDWKPTSPWYVDMCSSMNYDEKMIARELDVSFIGSGGNVIDDKHVEFHNKHNVREPIETRGLDNDIWIWAWPEEGHQYILASDVSRGDGEDFSTITIVDFTTMEQVMEYQGKMPPDLLAQLIEEYGEMYKAYSVVDITGGMGVATVLKLLEFNYKRLHYDDVNGKVLSSKQRELSNFNKDNQTPGFQATSVRLPMISNLELKIRMNEIKIRSSRLISELRTFVYRNGRPDHAAGAHDDCLKEGTLIKTINGYLPIEDINVGDLVLTHKGRYKPVECVLKKPFDGDWYSVDFQGQVKLELSYNHPLYAAPNTVVGLKKDKHSERIWVTPDKWVDYTTSKDQKLRQVSIKEVLSENVNHIITESDYYEKNKHETNNILDCLVLDKEFSKFLGLFLADGHSVKNMLNENGNNNYSFSLAFHVKDNDLCEEMGNYLAKLGIKTKRRSEKGNGFALVGSSKLFWYILNDCYDKNRSKILPWYAKYLGLDLEFVLDYWLKGDGWKDSRGHYDYIGATTSKQLALSMRDIAWSVGRYALIQEVRRHRYDVKNKNQFWVSIRKDFRLLDRIKTISQFEFGTKTVKVTKENFKGDVYNLRVADDESFIANGIVVHNCIMALGMGLWVLEHSFKKLERLQKQTKAMLNSWVMGGKGSPQTPDKERGSGFVSAENRNKMAFPKPNFNSRNIQDPTGQYLWLFSGMDKRKR